LSLAKKNLEMFLALETLRVKFGSRPNQRRSAIAIVAPDPTPTDTDVDTWNLDGSRGDLDLAALLAALALTDPDHAIIDN
jgi:hypothetical protein